MICFYLNSIYLQYRAARFGQKIYCDYFVIHWDFYMYVHGFFLAWRCIAKFTTWEFWPVVGMARWVNVCVCVCLYVAIICKDTLWSPYVDVYWMVYIGIMNPSSRVWHTTVLSFRLWAEEVMILLSHNTVTLFRWVMCLRSFLTCNADVCVLVYPMLSHLHNPFVWVIKSVKVGSERSHIWYTDFDPWERRLGIMP